MKQMWKRTGRGLLCLLLVLAMLSPAPVPLVGEAQAVTQDDIDALQADADALAEESQKLKSELAKIRSDKTQALNARVMLDQQIDLTQKKIANTESRISGYNALLDQTTYELEENQKQEAEQYELFCQRARVMEMQGTPSYWAVLFKATSFSDLLSRLADVQTVIDYDQQVIDDLRAIRVQIQEKQALQEELRTETEATKAQLEEQKAELAEQRQEAEKIYQEILADEALAAEALSAKNAEAERIQDEILKKTEELAAQMGWDTTSGGYIWPETKSKKITSPYGPRNTGLPGASTNHKGVDIGGVGYDTNVLATKAGVVITSAYSNSYGNYVVISHGRGNTTLYAHMSSRSVKEGDTVTQGQVIGVTGSTGISYGAHLHYEITENGSRVNPLDYLPGYIQSW